MMNSEMRSPEAVTRAMSLRAALVGCALTGLALLPLARLTQHVTSTPTVRSEPHKPATGGIRATPPVGNTGNVNRTSGRRNAIRENGVPREVDGYSDALHLAGQNRMQGHG